MFWSAAKVWTRPLYHFYVTNTSDPVKDQANVHICRTAQKGIFSPYHRKTVLRKPPLHTVHMLSLRDGCKFSEVLCLCSSDFP